MTGTSYAALISSAAPTSMVSLTSKGMTRRNVPARCIASSSTTVFSEEPDPSSTSVSHQRLAPRAFRDIRVYFDHQSLPRAGQQSFASRRPENAHLADGGKKLRYVDRTWPLGVAQHPPRKTCWLTMNLP